MVWKAGVPAGVLMILRMSWMTALESSPAFAIQNFAFKFKFNFSLVSVIILSPHQGRQLVLHLQQALIERIQLPLVQLEHVTLQLVVLLLGVALQLQVDIDPLAFLPTPSDPLVQPPVEVKQLGPLGDVSLDGVLPLYEG